MNRTDRLLAIVLELQARGTQRAEDLARTFEISKRTVYRDIQALCEAGVPVVAMPGRGYTLVDGYFLPPLSFSPDEAVMLLLGSDFMAQNFDERYQAAAQAASRKIAAVLPDDLRNEVQHLHNSMRFVTTSAFDDPHESDVLRRLRRAIITQTTVRLTYLTRYTATDTGSQHVRDVDPYGLVHLGDAWYLLGYCHLRQAIRHFRLDRIDDLLLRETSFERPPEFNLHQFRPDQRRNVIIRALFDPSVARWVAESRQYFITALEDTSEGLLVTFAVRLESELVQWLLGWGSHVRVLEPESLQQRLAEEAAAMLCNYQKRC